MKKNLPLGRNIHILRKQRGMTQEQLAELVDVQTNYISQIERGNKEPSLPTLYRIQQALDTDWESLMRAPRGTSPQENSSNQSHGKTRIPQIAGFVVKLEDEQFEALLKVARLFAKKSASTKPLK